MTDDLTLLFQRHAAEMQSQTPAESIHMMPRADLDRPEIAFYVLREEGRPVAMGAIKTIAKGHGEIKSMHVLRENRGRGLSRMLLDHLLGHAGTTGLSRLSLETGAQEAFGAARGLYSRAGFAECPPFGSYRPDPHSIFMTRDL
ncbi:GNAT family N-acetyltransferase [Paracoccus tegillarcae]|uniref:GNAT family N-acetyltransferase n=1 Tax=Paracoccus tegillarcae TaxID=1529068 RepID=UPI0030D59A96